MGRKFRHSKLNRRSNAAGNGGVIVSDADSFGPLEELTSVLRSEIDRLELDSKTKYPHVTEKKSKKISRKISGRWKWVRSIKKFVQNMKYGKRLLDSPYLEENTFSLIFEQKVYAPLGKRAPRITNNRSHITLSWTGDKDYHSAAWHQRSGDADVFEYFVQVFFKSGNIPPKEWIATHKDFSNPGAHAADLAWNDLPSNHFVVLARCSEITTNSSLRTLGSTMIAAHASGDLNIYTTNLHNCLSPPMPDKWFAFPGVIRSYNKTPNVTANNGQLRSILPGDSRPNWAPKNTESEPVRAVFEKSYNCSTAILTKIYPNGFTATFVDPKRWLYEKIRELVRNILSLIGILLSLFTSWYRFFPTMFFLLFAFIAFKAYPLLFDMWNSFRKFVPEILQDVDISNHPVTETFRRVGEWFVNKWEWLKDFFSS